MGAFKGAGEFFKQPLWKVAESMNYSEDNIIVLRGDIDQLEKKFPDTYDNLISCVHHADRRKPIEYGQDLVASWLIEDHFLSVLSSDKYDLYLGGADTNRRILPDVKTSAASDILVVKGDRHRKLELMNDYTGFWARSGKLHLRDAKYTQLQKDKALFIAISTTTGEFAIYDFRNEIPAKYIQSHKFYGYKPAYELDITRSMLKPISKENMAAAILELMEK